MFLCLLFVIGGLVLLVGAGDSLVRGAVRVASGFGVPPLVIGLTIVAMGTSAPELLVGINAVLSGAPTLALGNVVGSNIANILLVVGLPSLVAPVACSAPRLGRNYAFMITASILIYLLGIYPGEIGFPQALLLLCGLGLFLYWSVKYGRQGFILDEEQEADDAPKALSLPRAWMFLVAGLIGLPLGADLLVEGAVDIARTLNVSEAVIGLTLVAIGTSLPELAAAVAAAMRGHGDIAVGNVIGSNIFNVLGILGGSALFGVIPIPEDFMRLDLLIMLASSLLMAPFIRLRGVIGRPTGLVMVGAYIAYLYLLSQSAFG